MMKTLIWAARGNLLVIVGTLVAYFMGAGMGALLVAHFCCAE